MNMPPQNFLETYENILVPVGIIATIIFLYNFLLQIYSIVSLYFISKRDSFNPKNYGKWAVITGGNSGIGLSYANLLAKRGMNIIIISRTLETLRSTAEDIQMRYGVQCDYVQADFTDGEPAYEKIQRNLKNKDIGMVIISAGISGNAPCFFLQETDDDNIALIELHIRAVVFMIRVCLPLMLDKNRGAIVIVSSMASVLPLPLVNMYCACKAFSDRLTRAIAWEFNQKNVCIQSLIPSYVDTKMLNWFAKRIAWDRFFVLTPDCFCSSAFETVEFKNYTTDHWKHELLLFLTSHTPIWIINLYFTKYVAKKLSKSFKNQSST